MPQLYRSDRGWDRPTDAGQAWQIPGMAVLAGLLGQRDHDALGAADVHEPEGVLVVHHRAGQFGAVGEQAGYALVALLCWAANLLVAEWMIRARRSSPAMLRP